jgi:O-antigen biosynthesis protein
LASRHPGLLQCYNSLSDNEKNFLFDEIGGLDEYNLTVAYNDVNLCLKLIEKGYYIVYTPYAELYHYGSLTCGNDYEVDLEIKDPPKFYRTQREEQYMRIKWGKYIENDPYYNPNLT